jgi:hypothetical protein
VTSPPPRDRDIEAAKARKRARQQLAAGSAALSIVGGVLALVVRSSVYLGGDTGADFTLWLFIAFPCACFGLVGCVAATTVLVRGIALAGLLACAASAYIPPLFVRITGGPKSGESHAIGDIRTVISAESAYQSAAGHYGTITCLATPAGCIANYPANAPTFLDAGLAQPSVIIDGYRRQWFEKPSRSASTPGAIDEFCYAATPAVPNETGFRNFGGDSSGSIRETTPPLGIEILLQEWRGTASTAAGCCNQSRVDQVSCHTIQ